MTDDNDTKRKQLALERYQAAAHAMQTGVAFSMTFPGHKDTEPKHLRVGVNSAMSDVSALATLLIQKGIFTEAEYFEAIADAMERERDKYQSKMPASVRLA